MFTLMRLSEAVNHYLDLTKTLFGIFGEKQVKETNAKEKSPSVLKLALALL